MMVVRRVHDHVQQRAPHQRLQPHPHITRHQRRHRGLRHVPRHRGQRHEPQHPPAHHARPRAQQPPRRETHRQLVQHHPRPQHPARVPLLRQRRAVQQRVHRHPQQRQQQHRRVRLPHPHMKHPLGGGGEQVPGGQRQRHQRRPVLDGVRPHRQQHDPADAHQDEAIQEPLQRRRPPHRTRQQGTGGQGANAGEQQPVGDHDVASRCARNFGITARSPRPPGQSSEAMPPAPFTRRGPPPRSTPETGRHSPARRQRHPPSPPR